MPAPSGRPPRPKGPALTSLLKPYAPFIWTLVGLTVAGNALNLAVPRLISHAIDRYTGQRSIGTTLGMELLFIAVGIFTFSYLQNITQTYTAERVARDLRTRLIA